MLVTVSFICRFDSLQIILDHFVRIFSKIDAVSKKMRLNEVSTVTQLPKHQFFFPSAEQSFRITFELLYGI